MIPILMFNESNQGIIDISYLLEIFGGIISLLLLVVAFFLASLYNDFKLLKSQVYKNRENIAENILKDESDSREFNSYKELIKEKDKHFDKTLKKIDESILSLTKVTGELNVSVARLESKIK